MDQQQEKRTKLLKYIRDLTLGYTTYKSLKKQQLIDFYTLIIKDSSIKNINFSTGVAGITFDTTEIEKNLLLEQKVRGYTKPKGKKDTFVVKSLQIKRKQSEVTEDISKKVGDMTAETVENVIESKLPYLTPVKKQIGQAAKVLLTGNINKLFQATIYPGSTATGIIQKINKVFAKKQNEQSFLFWNWYRTNTTAIHKHFERKHPKTYKALRLRESIPVGMRKKDWDRLTKYYSEQTGFTYKK